MSDFSDLFNKIQTPDGQALALGLASMANLVQEYSNDEENPNVSAWLRSGAIEGIIKVEQAAYQQGLSDGI